MVVDVPGPLTTTKVRLDLSGRGTDTFEFVVDQSPRPDFPASLPQFVEGFSLDDRSRDCAAVAKRLALSDPSSAAQVEKWEANRWTAIASDTVGSLIKQRRAWCDRSGTGTLLRVGSPEKGWFYLLSGPAK